MKPRIPYPDGRTPEQEKIRSRSAKVIKDIRRYNSDLPAMPYLGTHKERVEWLKQANHKPSI